MSGWPKEKNLHNVKQKLF